MALSVTPIRTVHAAVVAANALKASGFIMSASISASIPQSPAYTQPASGPMASARGVVLGLTIGAVIWVLIGSMIFWPWL